MRALTAAASRDVADGGKGRASVVEERQQLRPFEGDGRTFWVVLVVAVRVSRTRDQRVEVQLDRVDARQHDYDKLEFTRDR